MYLLCGRIRLFSCVGVVSFVCIRVQLLWSSLSFQFMTVCIRVQLLWSGLSPVFDSLFKSAAAVVRSVSSF